jgi:hypothetical protein
MCSVVADVSPFPHNPGDELGRVFAVRCLLSLIAHLSNLTEEEAIEMGSKIGALIGLWLRG